MIKIAVVCVSDRSYRGEREDLSGPAISRELGDICQTVYSECVPDEADMIAAVLTRLCDSGDVSFVFTTGGTGIAPRDVTPEATMSIAQKLLPGMAHAICAKSLEVTPNAMLSRAVCAIRSGTLIINLPGSPKAVCECLQVVKPVLPHAAALMRGEVKDCARTQE